VAIVDRGAFCGRGDVIPPPAFISSVRRDNRLLKTADLQGARMTSPTFSPLGSLSPSPRGRGPSSCGALALLAGLALAGPAVGQVVSEQVAPGVVRFFASPSHQASAMPSVALEQPLAATGPAPVDFPISVDFTTHFGRESVGIDVEPGTSFYGTGMVSGPLLRNGQFVTAYNDDSYAYGDGDEQLYQSHPWVLGVRPDGSAFGVWADTTWRSEIDLTDTTGYDIRFTADGPEFAVYVIDEASPQAVLGTMSQLMGSMPMPPLWSIGYHQCRYSYTPDTRVMEVAQGFRDRDIPAEVIWMDIDYMDGFRIFSFNPTTFSDPAGLDADLDAIDFKSVWMINPGVKFEPGYSIYDAGEANDVWVKQPDGVSDFVGEVWPGLSKWPDFTNAGVRSWWSDLYGPFMANGIDGVWNDMNEPAVFYGPEWTMPDNNWHRADAALGGPGPHNRYHNIYGMQMVKASREGILAAKPNKRPFVLSRANYLGGHRYAACWTGDNVANEYHLDLSIPIVLNLGLSGQPFSGPDIGGFVNDGWDDLFARWMGVGAMLPFSRGHTTQNTRDKEPWAWGPDVERVSRLALNRRYRLLRHFYTAFYQAHTEGLPVARPLFFAEPENLGLRSEDDVFIVGDGLVVSTANNGGTACATSGATFPAPSGPLYRFGFPQSDAPGAPLDVEEPQLPDMFLLGGSIVPAGPIIQHSGEMVGTDLELIVALDENGEAEGVLYEDAGDGWGFQQGDYLLTTYRAETLPSGDVRVYVATTEGQRTRPTRDVTVRLLTGELTDVTATGIDGEDVTLTPPPSLVATVRNDLPAPAVDGCAIPSDFDASRGGAVLATQTTPTLWGDNSDELNQLFARLDEQGGVLHVGITGNLNAAALALFVDANPSDGQSQLDTTGLSAPPNGLPQLGGLAFDVGFAPEDLFYVNAFSDSGQFWIDQVALDAGAPASKTFRGTNFKETGNGDLTQGVNPNGLRVALTDHNTLGVNGVIADGADTATSGIEFSIPLADLDWVGSGANGCGSVRIAAVIVDGGGVVSNQMLPSLPNGPSNFGVAPDLAFVDGQQFASFGFGSLASDITGDGAVTGPDLVALLSEFGQTGVDLAGDITGDGAVTGADLVELLSQFGDSCDG
jgi:alpha-glucosidase